MNSKRHFNLELNEHGFSHQSRQLLRQILKGPLTKIAEMIIKDDDFLPRK